MVRVNESNLNLANEADSGYGQLISVLVRRRWWLLGVLCGVLSVATVYSLVAKPRYQSTMQLLIEPNYEGRNKEVGYAANQSDQFADSNVKIDDLATQINVMRSSLLIQRAVDLLSPEYPDLTVEKIKKALTLSQVTEDKKVETKIVQAVYIDKDPIKAQKVLQAILRVYQVYNREQQQQRLTKGLRFINEQIPSVRKQVDESESKLEQFRKRNNLIDPEQQATAVSQSLNAIEQERQAIRAQYQDNQSRYNELQKQLASSPKKAITASRLSQSARYQSLLNELQRTEMALAQRSVVFTDSDPTIQRLKEQRQSQVNMLRSEVARVLGAEDASKQVKEQGEGILTQGQLGGLDLNLTSELVAVQTNLGALKARDDSLAKTQQDFRQQLDRFPVLLAEFNRLAPLVEINRDKLQQLLRAQQELSLEIARGGFDWQALEDPLLGDQVAPNMKINLLLGLVVGLMLGSFAAFIREAVDDSVHSVEDLEQQTAIPMLGALPELPQGKASEPSVALPFGEPLATTPWTVQVSNWPPSWEALDLIYKNIQLQNMASCKSLMITSALAGEGKSTLALGLALSAARLHQRVLLIDADLRCPNLHRMLNLPNEQGLSTLLSNDVSEPSNIGFESSGSYIDVVTAGPVPKDPANLLSSHRMRELMTRFEQKYDMVILDAPPVLGMVDPILAASSCSGVVLVSRVGQVTKTEIAQATTMLSKLNVIGVVANGVNQTAKSYASYNRERDRDKEKGVVLNKVWG